MLALVSVRVGFYSPPIACALEKAMRSVALVTRKQTPDARSYTTKVYHRATVTALPRQQVRLPELIYSNSKGLAVTGSLAGALLSFPASLQRPSCLVLLLRGQVTHHVAPAEATAQRSALRHLICKAPDTLTEGAILRPSTSATLGEVRRADPRPFLQDYGPTGGHQVQAAPAGPAVGKGVLEASAAAHRLACVETARWSGGQAWCDP